MNRKRRKRKRKLAAITKSHLQKKYPRDKLGKASNYIVHFKKLIIQNSSLKVVLYYRVSRCWQKKNGNLNDQRKYLQGIIRQYEKKYGVKIDIVAEFNEVASGWKGDRKRLIAAARTAKMCGAVLVAESACRFIRNENYHSINRPYVLPTVSEYEALIDATKGVTLVTIMPPDTPWKKVKGYHAKRGQRSKNMFGGRPKGKYSGYMKDRREKHLKTVLRLYNKGYSVAYIVWKAKKATKKSIPRSTINDWIRKYNK
ncbi:MAG: recombinase family protein [Planctomycetota bacterium]|jgi:DNA invertase Pin-like site-specific DNA recombinase